MVREPPVDPVTFTRGSIVLIEVHDFLTYNHLVVKPGPRLNLILGPNGSGKSSIVCAICLGLAGKPQILGRSTTLSDYVRHGAEKSQIILELCNGPAAAPVRITRSFQLSHPGSIWEMDGKRCRECDVKERVSTMHIQVDNLCQFLAQDRVVEFARQRPPDLLLNTEKVIGEDLFAMHKELVDLGTSRAELETSIDRLEKDRAELARTKTNMEPDVECMTRRHVLKHRNDVLTKVLSWYEYEEARLEAQTLNRGHKELKAELEAAKAKNAPLYKELQKLKRQKERVIEEFTKMQENAAKLLVEAKDKFSKKRNEIHATLQTEARKLQEAADNEKHHNERLNELNGKIRGLELQAAQTSGGDTEDQLLRDIALATHEIKAWTPGRRGWRSRLRGWGMRRIGSGMPKLR